MEPTTEPTIRVTTEAPALEHPAINTPSQPTQQIYVTSREGLPTSEDIVTDRVLTLQTPKSVQRQKCDSPTHRQKIGSMKIFCVPTDKVINIGEQWKTIDFVEQLAELLGRLYLKMEASESRKFVYTLYCLSFIGNCIISALSLMLYGNDMNPLLTYLVLTNMAICFLPLGCTGYSLVLICRQTAISSELSACSLLGTTLYLCVGLFALILITDVSTILAILTGLCLYISCFYMITAGALIAALTPFIIFGLIVELFIRSAKGKLECPKQETLVKNFACQTFLYKAGTYSTKECVICLALFEENDEIALLKCHESHIFHMCCIFEWIKRNTWCPVCRQEMLFILY